MPPASLICDGCGQPADATHLARRLKRLENMTRYRPIHVQALFLGAASPAADREYLYSAEGEFRGEGQALLRALGVDPAGKPVEAALAEFQRHGYLLAHILECPGPEGAPEALTLLLGKRGAILAARIRRSLKPKKLVLLGRELDVLGESLGKELPGVEMVRPEQGGSFRLEDVATGVLAAALAGAVTASL
ncbi:MAG TPA: hypothetical protein VKB24_00750 [Candidatus Acidoferrum sp.]|nr:hypothetical protein [Candidatus Acidoferrum sp.]